MTDSAEISSLRTRLASNVAKLCLFFAMLCAIQVFCMAQDGGVSEAALSQHPIQTAIGPSRQHESLVNTYKTNYFSANNWPGSTASQVKFQISMKFRLLKPDLYVFEHSYFPIYVAYTQKSLWNIGQPSAPFEETNYNPELFLDYPVNLAVYRQLKLRNVVVGLFEHESNGMAGLQSRSWNRQYVMCRLGLEPMEQLHEPDSFSPDKVSFYIKLWLPSGYSDQNEYLRSIGSSDDFLDYAGRGEVGLSVRNFLWGGPLKDHLLDIRTTILRNPHKPSWQFEFRQQVPGINFSLYLQYWYGYGETLLRFDQFGHRGFAGISFSY